MKRYLSTQSCAEFAASKLATSVVWLAGPKMHSSIAMLVDDGSLTEDELLTCLSVHEKSAAQTLGDRTEKRHFMLRRAFQRSFLGVVSDWQGAISEISSQHQRDTRPTCLAAPELCLSFSSSGVIAVACASRSAQLGIDIERLRTVGDPLALSTRFFNLQETAYLAALPKALQEIEFLKFWTIKEACLKAIGKGIVFGLDTFSIVVKAGNYSVNPAAAFGGMKNWTIEFLEVPEG